MSNPLCFLFTCWGLSCLVLTVLLPLWHLGTVCLSAMRVLVVFGHFLFVELELQRARPVDSPWVNRLGRWCVAAVQLYMLCIYIYSWFWRGYTLLSPPLYTFSFEGGNEAKCCALRVQERGKTTRIQTGVPAVSHQSQRRKRERKGDKNGTRRIVFIYQQTALSVSISPLIWGRVVSVLKPWRFFGSTAMETRHPNQEKRGFWYRKYIIFKESQTAVHLLSFFLSFFRRRR